jgi:long-chain fatty acid transport protein
MTTRCSLIVAAALAVAFASAARSDGFRNPPDTAAALGKGGNARAWVDDPSAVFFNPANLADVASPQVLFSGTLGYGDSSCRNALGMETGTDLPWSVLPSAAVAWPLEPGKLSAGLGVHTPFGRQTRWDADGFFRLTAPVLSRMMVVDVSPAVAWRPAQRLTVGAGFDAYYGRLKFSQYIPPVAPYFGGVASAEADGWAAGANAGVTCQLAPGQRLSLTGRAPFDLDFEGDLHIRDNPGLPPSSDLSSTFRFPAVLALAYGVKVTETVRLEADVEWAEFSRFRTLSMDNTVLQAMNTSEIPQDWDDTWTFGLGGDWRFAERWTLRAGCLYLQTPTRDQTFLPSMLDDDQAMVSLGLGYRAGRHAVDLAGAHGLFDTRRVRGNQNPAYDGDYEFAAELLTLTYTAGF